MENNLQNTTASNLVNGAKPEVIALLCDNSGSMDCYWSGITRLEAVKKAVGAILSVSSPRLSKYGLLFFSSTAYCAIAPTNRFHTIQMYNRWQVEGSTIMSAGIELALQQPDINRIILLSDGAPTENEDFLFSVVQKAANAHVKIDTVGIGGADTAILQKISEMTGGKFSCPETPEMLSLVYQQHETRQYLTYNPIV